MRNFSFLVSLLLENLVQGCFNEIGRDSEADAASGGIGLGIDRGQCWNTAELPLQIDQGPTAIARIDGGTGLVLLVACSLSPACFKHSFDALYEYLSHVAHLRHNGAHIVISTTRQRRLDECMGCI